MKLIKPLMLAATILAMSACSTNKGAALTLENASSYIAPLQEGVGNAGYKDNTVSFRLYPNSEKGKLFDTDVKGKCDVTFKYGEGLFDWNDPVEIKNVSFTYKAGGQSESGSEADYLAASFTYEVPSGKGLFNVYNVKITEISGHMQA